MFTLIDFQKKRFKEIRFFGKIGFLTRPKYLSEIGDGSEIKPLKSKSYNIMALTATL
jgi:hypothetical protein